MSWLSRRKSYKVTPENGKNGPQLRVSPTPCCGREKQGNAVTINTSTGLWCCFKCGKKGNWYGFTRLAGDPLHDPYEDAAPIDLSVYERVRARRRRPVSQGHHPALLEYCLKRGFTPETLDAWRVSTCGPEALRWPMMAVSPAGEWVIANARIRKVINRDEAHSPGDWFEIKGGPTSLPMGAHLLGQEPVSWHSNRPVWGDQWLAPKRTYPGTPSSITDPVANTISQPLKIKRVLITEGQWDAMTAWQLGIPNVLSLPNGNAHVDVSGLLRYVPDDAEVWLALDMDEAGDRCAEAFFSQLGSQVRRLVLPVKDLNQWLQDWPQLTAEEVLATAEKEPDAVKPGGGVVSLASVVKPVACEIIVETPWPRLTRRLGGGFRAGATTGLLAPSGSGKTTICNNILAHAIYRGVVSGVIQLEGLIDENIVKLKDQIHGWIKPDIEEDLDRYLPNLKLSSLVGKRITLEQTLEAAEELIVTHGARFIVMDNWDYITPPDGHGHRLKAEAYAEFQEICKRHRVHGLVVWQPNKVDREKNINSGQQKGMSTALQDADVYMTVNKHGITRRLEVEKARGVDELSDADSVIWLRYDRERHSLFETDSQADLKPMSLEKPDTDKF
jgi:hypothetical protein